MYTLVDSTHRFLVSRHQDCTRFLRKGITRVTWNSFELFQLCQALRCTDFTRTQTSQKTIMKPLRQLHLFICLLEYACNRQISAELLPHHLRIRPSSKAYAGIHVHSTNVFLFFKPSDSLHRSFHTTKSDVLPTTPSAHSNALRVHKHIRLKLISLSFAFHGDHEKLSSGCDARFHPSY